MKGPPDFSTRPASARVASTPELLLLGLCGLVLIASGYAAFDASAKARAAQASVAALREETEAARARLGALDASQHAGGDTQTSQLVLAARLPPVRIVADLAGLLPADVRLEGLSLRYGSLLEIETQVVARRPAAYDAFLERLSASVFRDVLPGAELREGEMHASVRMTRRPGS